MSILFLTLARLLSIVIGVLLAPHLFAADITYCLVAKGRLYHQTNANEVATGPRPFVRHSIVNGNLAVGPTWVFAPNSIPASLSGTYSSRVQEQTLFARTSSALEQLSPNGTYRIEMATETEGRRTNRITLPAGVTYPNPPTIQNYTEAQKHRSSIEFYASVATFYQRHGRRPDHPDYLRLSVSEFGALVSDRELPLRPGEDRRNTDLISNSGRNPGPGSHLYRTFTL